MGFDKVFDTNFGADLTIVEEATEFIRRLQKSERLPLITSCSPGWIKFMERFYPELIPLRLDLQVADEHAVGAAQDLLRREDGHRPEEDLRGGGHALHGQEVRGRRAPSTCTPWGAPYTDAVLTTRELIWMMKCLGMDFRNLPDGEFDSPLGVSSGAADIFGATGGVMEAALRTAYEKVTGQELRGPGFRGGPRRGGREGDRRSTSTARRINVGVANGLQNAKTLLDKVVSGEKQYHIIEIMACPGGCVAAAASRIRRAGMHVLDPKLARLRAKALYTIDGRRSCASRTRTRPSSSCTRNSWARRTATSPTNCCTRTTSPSIREV